MFGRFFFSSKIHNNNNNNNNNINNINININTNNNNMIMEIINQKVFYNIIKVIEN